MGEAENIWRPSRVSNFDVGFVGFDFAELFFCANMWGSFLSLALVTHANAAQRDSKESTSSRRSNNVPLRAYLDRSGSACTVGLRKTIEGSGDEPIEAV